MKYFLIGMLIGLAVLVAAHSLMQVLADKVTCEPAEPSQEMIPKELSLMVSRKGNVGLLFHGDPIDKDPVHVLQVGDMCSTINLDTETVIETWHRCGQ